jgi:hypothetical protein
MVSDSKQVGHQRGFGGLLQSGAMAIFTFVLLGAVVLLVLGSFAGTMTPDSSEANATLAGISAISGMFDLIAPLGIMVVAAAIIGVAYLFTRGSGR